MTDGDQTVHSADGMERSADECPRCGSQGAQNPILDDWYECNNCVISFSADGEVEEGE